MSLILIVSGYNRVKNSWGIEDRPVREQPVRCVTASIYERTFKGTGFYYDFPEILLEGKEAIAKYDNHHELLYRYKRKTDFRLLLETSYRGLSERTLVFN